MKDVGIFPKTLTVMDHWSFARSMTAETFRMTESEIASFSQSKVATLIGTLPFIAGCDESMRTSLAHLAIYITGIRGGRHVFDHTTSDDADVFARLRLGMSFKGGDQNKIDHGMNLLALTMLCGYERDRQKDFLSGDYNPLNALSWDFTAIHDNLKNKITAHEYPEIDGILSLEEAVKANWD